MVSFFFFLLRQFISLPLPASALCLLFDFLLEKKTFTKKKEKKKKCLLACASSNIWMKKKRRRRRRRRRRGRRRKSRADWLHHAQGRHYSDWINRYAQLVIRLLLAPNEADLLIRVTHTDKETVDTGTCIKPKGEREREEETLWFIWLILLYFLFFSFFSSFLFPSQWINKQAVWQATSKARCTFFAFFFFSSSFHSLNPCFLWS